MPLLAEQILAAALQALLSDPPKTLAQLKAAAALAAKLEDTLAQHFADAQPTQPDSGLAEELPPDAPLS